jgi:hypothetical protein
MADKKISALTAASTPLAGTEVLPIVQSGATVKVATDDLTVRNFRANATTGILQVTGPAAASTRVMTVPNANFTAARTDAAQSFTGDQTLSTGNLVIGTSGKGVDFSATPGTGTSELLADYEEGTWTPEYEPDLGAFTSITYGFNSGKYIKIGNLVYVTWFMRTSSLVVGTASSNVYIKNLPFTVANASPNPYFAFGIGNDFLVNNARAGGCLSNTTRILLKQAFNNVSINVTDLGLGGADNFTAGFVCYYVS